MWDMKHKLNGNKFYEIPSWTLTRSISQNIQFFSVLSMPLPTNDMETPVIWKYFPGINILDNSVGQDVKIIN